MARPKMTDDEKAAARAAREAAKAGVSAAADRAEARSAAGKTTASAPKADDKPHSINSEFDQEEKAIFLRHLPTIKNLMAKFDTASDNLKAAYKLAKTEAGFTKADFQTAIAVETAEAEAKERAKIARTLKIAKIMGSSLGAQLDMFLAPEPDRTPLADRAFHEGESDAMQNIPARPSYDPSTEAYRRYLDGFHSVSERLIKEGMGTLAPEERDAAAFGEFDAEAAGKPADAAPSSGVPMTLAQFKASQEAAKAAGTKH